MQVKRSNGIAGQFQLTADTDDGPLSFVGDTYGRPGPVVMVLPSGTQTFVTDPGRFGPVFDESWVRSFVAAASENGR